MGTWGSDKGGISNQLWNNYSKKLKGLKIIVRNLYNMVSNLRLNKNLTAKKIFRPIKILEENVRKMYVMEKSQKQ